MAQFWPGRRAHLVLISDEARLVRLDARSAKTCLAESTLPYFENDNPRRSAASRPISALCGGMGRLWLPRMDGLIAWV